jgi:hypothetical protein
LYLPIQLHRKIGRKEKEKEALPTIMVNWLVGLGMLEQQYQPKSSHRLDF